MQKRYKKDSIKASSGKQERPIFQMSYNKFFIHLQCTSLILPNFLSSNKATICEVCNLDNFESHNSLKLSFINIWFEMTLSLELIDT